MSMYGAVFPDENRSQRIGMLIACIGDPVEPFTDLRLRDAWVEKDHGEGGIELPVICLYTRNGGGNREHTGEDGCTACAGEDATEHPSYLSDEDDVFDSTYRTYRFRVGNPLIGSDIMQTLLEVADDEPRDMSAVWLRAIDAMEAK